MRIIDAHLHFSSIESFKRTAADLSGVDYSCEGLEKEFAANGIEAGIGMGLEEVSPGAFPDMEAGNPMLLDLDGKRPAALAYCLGINPERLRGEERQEELRKIEERLADGHAAGIKIYAGYYRHYVYDDIYQPVYDLAARYGLPVVIHSGDTYSERGLLKYSHPLTMDELAVMRRDVNFVICHMGDPWVMDTANVVRKNYNVYADLSGLVVGDSVKVQEMMGERLFMDHFKRALVYAERYDRFLFGSDWPLVPMKPYINFIKALIPEQYHTGVFHDNALKVFTRLEGLLIRSSRI